MGALEVEVGRVKTRLGLPPTAAVLSCYEAGRDGVWIHRWLETHGITNYVVDSSSIEVSRRDAKQLEPAPSGRWKTTKVSCVRRPSGV